MKRKFSNVLSLILIACILISTLGIAPSLAQEGGVLPACPANHPAHDETCGYAEAAPCAVEAAHTHDGACGYDGVNPESCTFTHQHDEACGYKAAQPCTHSCILCTEVQAPLPQSPAPQTPSIDNIKITAVTPLSFEQLYRSYLPGEAPAEADLILTFPETLSVTTSANAEFSPLSVTWECDTTYTEDGEGEYVFSAVPPAGYEADTGVSLPQIVVFVENPVTVLSSGSNIIDLSDTSADIKTAADNSNLNYAYDTDGDTITILKEDITITGSRSTPKGTAPVDTKQLSIVVATGYTGKITLNGASITFAAANRCAFALQGNAAVTLDLLDGTANSFSSGADQPGISVPSTAMLTITGSTGTLSATGGSADAFTPGGAGIGGARATACGDVTIEGGTVTAQGAVCAAGIGGGGASGSNNGGACGNISVSGGTLSATGGNGGAGIGGGGSVSEAGGSLASFTMTGGKVTATGNVIDTNKSGAGIGGGGGYGGGGNGGDNGGSISISGGIVTAEGKATAAGIGGGGSAANGPGGSAVITISGGFVTAEGRMNATTGAASDIGKGVGGGTGTASVVINGGSVWPRRGSAYVDSPKDSTGGLDIFMVTVPATATINNIAGRDLTGGRQIKTVTGYRAKTVSGANEHGADFVTNTGAAAYIWLPARFYDSTIEVYPYNGGNAYVNTTPPVVDPPISQNIVYWLGSSTVVEIDVSVGTGDYIISADTVGSLPDRLMVFQGSREVAKEIAYYQLISFSSTGQTTNGIIVDGTSLGGLTVNVELAGVNINKSAASGSAFDLQNGGANNEASVLLSLGNTNTLIGASGKAGLHAPADAELIMQETYIPEHIPGSLTTTGGSGSAGIGGSTGEASGNIAITGGEITANGVAGAAGIGGGSSSGNGSVITITGGEIAANGTDGAAGIGGGSGGDGGTVTIEGGTVYASAGNTGAGAGIGGGEGAPDGGGTTVISGGTVTATGGDGGAGIGSGGGSGNSNNSVTISGTNTKVIATSNGYGAGIGGGSGKDSGVIRINGGTVTATGGAGGAGIGGGGSATAAGSAGSIAVTDGVVIARGGTDAAGIGGGYGTSGGNGGDVRISGGYVTAIGSGDAQDFGKSDNGLDEGSVVITSGSVWARNSKLPLPTDGRGNVVYRVDVPATTDDGVILDDGSSHEVKLTAPVYNANTVSNLDEHTSDFVDATDAVALIWLPENYYTAITVAGTTGPGWALVVQKPNTAYDDHNQVNWRDTQVRSHFFLADDRAFDITIEKGTYDDTLLITYGTKPDAQDPVTYPSEKMEELYPDFYTFEIQQDDDDGKVEKHGITVNGAGVTDTVNVIITDLNVVRDSSDAQTFILEDGAEVDLTLSGANTFTSKSMRAGVEVPTNCSLTVGGTGSLLAQGATGGAGIGGTQVIGGSDGGSGSITINSGNVTAIGSANSAGVGGGGANGSDAGGASQGVTIAGSSITSAKVIATGEGYGAGIGGGGSDTGAGGGFSGAVTLSGGSITANGGANGTGIGGGGSGTTGSGGAGAAVTISGATAAVTTIVSTGYGHGAGIGSGANAAASGTVTILAGAGADVTATGGTHGAGIGGGYGAPGATVNINGGIVKAIAPANSYGAGIGGGGVSGAATGGAGGTVSVNSAQSVTVSSAHGAGIGGGGSVSGIGGAGATVTHGAGALTIAVSGQGAGIGGGGSTTGAGEGGAAGDFSKASGAGALNITLSGVGGNGAGIGGGGAGDTGDGGDSGTVRISSGVGLISVTGNGAGIGGGGSEDGDGGDSGSVKIESNAVISDITVSGNGAGIGGGGSNGGNGGDASISGGNTFAYESNTGSVTINGTGNGAGIGGGGSTGGNGGSLTSPATINGGTTTIVKGTGNGAGIGGGGTASTDGSATGGSGNTVTIGATTPATVTSPGAGHGAGIGGGGVSGGGTAGSGGAVTIGSATVTATSTGNGAGIGGGGAGDGGKGGNGGAVSIGGASASATVTATGSGNGAGIGGGGAGIGGRAGTGGNYTSNGASTLVTATASGTGAGVGGGGATGAASIGGAATGTFTATNGKTVASSTGGSDGGGGAGIGGGYGMNTGGAGYPDVTIGNASSAIVQATSAHGTGIGGGTGGTSGNGGAVTISGGYVTANGVVKDIGSGSSTNATDGSVVITGGSVWAVHDTPAALSMPQPTAADGTTKVYRVTVPKTTDTNVNLNTGTRIPVTLSSPSYSANTVSFANEHGTGFVGATEAVAYIWLPVNYYPAVNVTGPGNGWVIVSGDEKRLASGDAEQNLVRWTDIASLTYTLNNTCGLIIEDGDTSNRTLRIMQVDEKGDPVTDGIRVIPANKGTEIIVRQTSTTEKHFILVDGQDMLPANTVNLTLSGVTIERVVGIANPATEAAFEIKNNAVVRVIYSGTNNLLAAGSTAGLQVPTGSTLTLQQATTGTNALTATGVAGGAGIGGGNSLGGGTITISGGTVTANGAGGGAGIGGGNGRDGGAITINGGTITATGTNGGAGIGGGNSGSNTSVTITTGAITATANGNSSAAGAAGIGGGIDGDGGTISLGSTLAADNKGLLVKAKGGAAAYDIGAGENGAPATVTILGGNIMTGEDGVGGDANRRVQDPKDGTGRSVYRVKVTAERDFDGAPLFGKDINVTDSSFTPDVAYDAHTLPAADSNYPGMAAHIWLPKGYYKATITVGSYAAGWADVVDLPPADPSTNPGQNTVYWKSYEFVMEKGDIVVSQGPAGKFRVTQGPQVYQDIDYGTTILITQNDPDETYPYTIMVDGASGIPANQVVSISLGKLDGKVSLDETLRTTPGASAFSIIPNPSGPTQVSLTVNGQNTLVSDDDRAGVEVPEGASLTLIKGAGDSILNATGGAGGAGIGGAGVGTDRSAGDITIGDLSGGPTVSATGGAGAAGIGGGTGTGPLQTAHSGNITITNSDVTALATAGGAGIGGGSYGNGKTIAITASTVDATGGTDGAGIGGGSDGDSESITITGSTVASRAGAGGAAGIGGGNSGNSDGIVIDTNSDVTAIATSGGAGIGSGDGGDSDSIEVSGSKVNATGGTNGAGIGGGNSGSSTLIEITDSEVTAQAGTGGAGIGSGNGGHSDTITIEGSNVNATGGTDAAGIGGGNGGNSDGVTITSSEIIAQAGAGGAGIGSGNGGISDTVTIEDSNVNATGGTDAAGIGGGNGGHSDTVTISGGEVTATAGAGGAGVGGGSGGNSTTITVTDSTLVATGDGYGAGIGGGKYGTGGSIGLVGSEVTAQAGAAGNEGNGAGVGGGGSDDNTKAAGAGGDITVMGGTLIATGGSVAQTGGAGIGGGGMNDATGAGGNGAEVLINQGAEVTAAGGAGAAGIGGGFGPDMGGNGMDSAGVEITGGSIVEATGGNDISNSYGGAGIGGGGSSEDGSMAGAGADVSIGSAGTSVTATGGGPAAGIGGGDAAGGGSTGGSGGDVTISDGTVVATGGINGAGIGGGSAPDFNINGGIGGDGGSLTMTGGNVTATGGALAAGVGGGYGYDTGGDGAVVTIDGGVLLATGGTDAAGIGGGFGRTNGGDAVTFELSAGFVTAISGGLNSGAFDIGGGGSAAPANAGADGTVKITGGSLWAVNDTPALSSMPQPDNGTVDVFATIVPTIEDIDGNSILDMPVNVAGTLATYTARTVSDAEEHGASFAHGAVIWLPRGYYNGSASSITVGPYTAGRADVSAATLATTPFTTPQPTQNLVYWNLEAEQIFNIDRGDIFIYDNDANEPGTIVVRQGGVESIVPKEAHINITQTSQTALPYGIDVDGSGLDSVDLELSGLQLDTTGATPPISPLQLHDGANVTLTLSGANKLTADDGLAGINVPAGNTITIGGDGSAEVTGGTGAAGIGGNDGQSSGSITVTGGDVTALGGTDAPGIGGGSGGNGGDVVITGGRTSAMAGSTNVKDIGAGEGGASQGTLDIDGRPGGRPTLRLLRTGVDTDVIAIGVSIIEDASGRIGGTYSLLTVTNGTSVYDKQPYWKTNIVKAGTTVELSSTLPVQFGHNIVWNIIEGPVPGFNGASASTSFTMPENDVSLTSVYDRGTYTLTYDTDGADTDTPAPVTFRYADDVRLAGAPEKYGYSFLGWKSSVDEQIYGAGQVVTLYAQDITFTAQWAVIHVTGVTISADNATLTVGQSIDLIATVLPDNALNQALTWSSSDPSIATVDANGRVTALRPGTVVITVTTEDGSFTATCTITVIALPTGGGTTTIGSSGGMGDNSNLTLWILVSLLSVLSGICALLLRQWYEQRLRS